MFTFTITSTLCGILLMLLPLQGTSAIPNPSTSSFFGFSSGIGIIEDAAEKTSGFLVYTSDNNYAIYSKHLVHLGWESISVNDQQAFVVTSDKKTFSTPLNTLGFKNLATLDYIKSEFLLNLAGLVIDHPNRLPSSYRVLYSTEGKFQGTILPNGILALPSSPTGAANGLNGVHGFDSSYLQPYNSLNQASLPTGAYPYSSGAYNSGYGKKPSSEYLEKEGYRVYYCNNQVSNYYNTLGPLNSSRTGDVYFFDYCGHNLNIYSDSVSISNRPIGTSVYRDSDYFTVYAPLLSCTINRVFLVDHSVFIIYNDGSVFVKLVKSLDPQEVEVVEAARSYVRKLQLYKEEAVLVSKKLRKGSLSITTFLEKKQPLLVGEELIKTKTIEKVTTVDNEIIGSLPVLARTLSANSTPNSSVGVNIAAPAIPTGVNLSASV